jgi:hypothetical protein
VTVAVAPDSGAVIVMQVTRRDVLRWSGIGGGLAASGAGGGFTRVPDTGRRATERARGARQDRSGLLAAFNALSEAVEFLVDGRPVTDPVPPGEKLTHTTTMPGSYTLTVRVEGGETSDPLTFEIGSGEVRTMAAVGSPAAPTGEVLDDRRIDFDEPFSRMSWYQTAYDTRVEAITCPLSDPTASKQPYTLFHAGRATPSLSVLEDTDTNAGLVMWELFVPDEDPSRPVASTGVELLQNGFQKRGFLTTTRDGEPFPTVQGVNDLRSTVYFWNLTDEPVTVWGADPGGEFERIVTLDPGAPSEVFSRNPGLGFVGFGPTDADGPTTTSLGTFYTGDFGIYTESLEEPPQILELPSTSPAPDPESEFGTLRVTNRGSRFLQVEFDHLDRVADCPFGSQVLLYLTREVDVDRAVDEARENDPFGFIGGPGSDIERFATLFVPDSDIIPSVSGSTPIFADEGTLRVTDVVTGAVVFEREVTIEPGKSYDLLVPKDPRADVGFVESPIDETTSVLREMKQTLIID